MRLLVLAANALVGGAALARALPAGSCPGVPDPAAGDDASCCCCDPEMGAISCLVGGRPGIQCRCLDVDCPPDASTVYHHPAPTPTGEPCCCCDVELGAFACRFRDAEDGCVCAQVVCPPGASTVWPYEPTPAPYLDTWGPR